MQQMDIKKYSTYYIIFGVIFLGILPLYFVFNPTEFNLFPDCPFYKLTGFYCTGCGSQRAFHDLLHLNIAGTIGHNALFLPSILLVAYHFIIKYLEFKNEKNYKNLLYARYTPLIILLVMVVFTVSRNIDIHPFRILAP